MNRRRFLELLGSAALGSGIVYSFPSVIVPKNTSSSSIVFRVVDDPVYEFGFSGYERSDFNKAVIAEIYPKLIDDIFLIDTPNDIYWRKKLGIHSLSYV